MIIQFMINYLKKRWYYIYTKPKIIDDIIPNIYQETPCSLYIDRLQLVNWKEVLQNIVVYEWEEHSYRRNQIIWYLNHLNSNEVAQNIVAYEWEDPSCRRNQIIWYIKYWNIKDSIISNIPQNEL